MKFQLTNRLLVTLLICGIWMFAIRVVSSTSFNYYDDWMKIFLGVSVFTSLLTYGIFRLYHPDTSKERRQRKVEKLLSQLDSEERSILFNRLAAPEDDGEYAAMEALLSEHKRKRS
jgi:hypothetical protein